MGGLYTHTTRATGLVLTATIYNADHVNHITNQTPSMTDDSSADVTAMQLVTDPGGVGTESLATSLSGEIERLRFAVKRIAGGAQWYVAPTYSIPDLITAVGMPTGVVADFVGATAPTGWVLLSGLTIGDASSGATGRAHADTSALFTLLWNSMADAEAPVPGGRGATAAADYAAHKTITLPDARGRVVAGKDNMSGVSANRLTTPLDGDTLGAAAGVESHALTTAELAVHTHGITDPGHTHAPSGGGNFAVNRSGANDMGSGSDMTYATTTASATTGITAANTGSGTAHPNVQPTLVLNKIIKL